MKYATLILAPTDITNDAPAGLTLQARGSWIHGVLAVVDEHEAGSAADWLRELFLIAISECGTIPNISRVCLQDAFLNPPVWRNGKLSFTTHETWIWNQPLHPELHFVHAAARDLLSPSIEFRPNAEDNTPIDTPIVRAYDLAHRNRHSEALAAFQRALANPELASDLDAAHRYNAACVAARVGHTALASSMIQQDLWERSQAHTRLTFDAAVEGAMDAQSAVDKLLEDHVRMLQRDPDLIAIREVAAVTAR